MKLSFPMGLTMSFPKTIFRIFLLLLFISGNTFAQSTYYIDAVNGNDANNGRSESAAWKTVNKVGSFNGFASGDIISFKRGQSHFGRLVPPVNGLNFNAYGSGSLPEITGAIDQNTWTDIGGGVFETSIGVAPKIIMINGRKYSKGRYPDNGWLNIDNTSGGNITSSGLSGRNFTGGKAVIRKNRWIIDNDSISNQSGNTINFTYKYYAPKQNFKFFITDHLSCLDTYGEWYYDHASRKLRVFFGGNGSSSVKASVLDNVVSITGISNTTFRDLSFSFANQEIVYLSSTNNTRFSNCTFEYGYNAMGFWSGSNTNANISNCTFRYMNNNGLYMPESGSNNGFVLENSNFHQIGAIPGEGGNGDGTYTAVNMGGGFLEIGPTSSARVSFNRFDTVGYVAIMGGGENLLVSNNVINYYCTIKDDGGAIYDTGPGVNKRITGNIVLNGAIGAWQGTDDQNTFAYGIYMDNDANTFEIDNNSVANGVIGIFLHDSRNINVHDNNIFNMKDKSIMIWRSGLGQNPVSGLDVQNNIAVNIDQTSRLLDIQNLSGDGKSIATFGIINNNYYCRPLDDSKIIYSTGNYQTLPEWQRLYGYDKDSKQSPKTFSKNINPDDSIKFVYNPTNSQQTTSLNGTYIDAKNNQYVSSITLAAYSSATLFVNSTITVAPNQAPQANAGNDQIITLPTNSVTLTGSGVDADGTISSYEWRKLSGPNGDIINKAAAVVTLITGLVVGVYVYRLTITDNKGATSFDDVQITVNNAPPPPVVNSVPTVNAGQDIAIALPDNTVTLKGNASDSDGSIASYIWTKVSGPAGGNLQSAGAASTVVTGLNAGTYVFRLTVTDNSGAVATDDVSVLVNTSLAPSPSNQAPTANAGNDINVTLPTNSATLTGSGTDADGSVTSYAWSKVSGPAGGNLQSAGAASTVVTGLNAGTYVFRLTVTDNSGAQATDDVSILVNTSLAPSPSNQAPTANAGNDINVTLPTNRATLTGSGTDADGSVTSYSWSKVSGPTGGNIQTTNAASTSITGLTSGTYIFRLTVTDNSGAQATDDVQVLVTAAPPVAGNQLPTANAGSNLSITLPVNTVTLSGSGNDADGSITTFAWAKISGPVGGNIQTPTGANTVLTGLIEGTYTFRLTVTDNAGATATDDVQVIVNASPIAPNTAPIANAGHDLNITLPTNSVTLNGTASSDPDGSIVSFNWRKVQGPSGSSFSSTNIASPVLNGLARGQYEFELTITDNRGATSTDRVLVTVIKINQKPVARLSRDTIKVAMPVQNTELSALDSYDPDGVITTYAWTYKNGPRDPKILTPQSSKTIVADLVTGTYEFDLVVTDDDGDIDKKSVVVIVKNSSNRRLIPEVSVYPNPASNMVNIKINSDVEGRTTITFIDINGRPALTDVFVKGYGSYSRQVNIGRLPKGTYTVLIQVDQTEKVVKKLIKL
jgi:parallel beta-helix repeat protein